MSNTHEYVIFDRAKVEPALAMKWPEFEKKYPGWFQWGSAREFLVEWGLHLQYIERVDEIIARKTVRQTILMGSGNFSILWAILEYKGLMSGSVDIEKGNWNYGDELVACAGAAHERGDISFATLTAVYHLHTCWVDPMEVLPEDIARALNEKPRPRTMLPGLPHIRPDGNSNDMLGVLPARRFISFLLQAWKERWPLHDHCPWSRQCPTIRSSTVADELVKILRRRKLAKPCIFRWYENL